MPAPPLPYPLDRPIGIFDSGVGGLTVLKALRRKLPHRDFIYLGDTARVPYGRKPAAMVADFAFGITEFLRRMDVEGVRQTGVHQPYPLARSLSYRSAASQGFWRPGAFGKNGSPKTPWARFVSPANCRSLALLAQWCGPKRDRHPH